MIEVRPMREEDHPGVLVVAESVTGWFDADARHRAIPVDLRHQEGFVAVSKGQVVGFITVFVAEGRLNIGWMGVRPEQHRHGIGTRLLTRAEQSAREKGLMEIATFTLGAGVDYEPYEATRAFYFKSGFRIYQTNKTDNPGCPEEIKIKKVIA